MNAPQSGVRPDVRSKLTAAKSVDAVRESLRASVPSLAPGKLTRIAVLGAGPEGLRLVGICRDQGIEVVGLYDGNARKRGMTLDGLTIYPSEALTRLPKDVPIVVASHRVLGACESLRALGYVAVPIAFLQCAYPDRFPPHSFYEDLLEDLIDNRDQYLGLYDLFADATSREVLDAVIGYRLSLDPLYLRDAIDWDLYGSLEFGTDEVYVDGGTYNGDSIQLFIEHVNGSYSAIHGFEPDARTFKVLQERLRGTRDVELHNCGLYSRTTSLGFSADSSRAARIDEQSGTKIDVASLDDEVKGRVTFIKMNIEGAEIDALNGARRTIAEWAPKLAISAYHRAPDLWRLCHLILALNDRYQLALRQHDGGIIETVIYATPRG